MPRNKLFLMIVVLILPVVLTACGSELNAENLEAALEKSYTENDYGDLNDLSCEDEQVNEDEVVDRDITYTINSVDCNVNDDTFSCEVQVEEDDIEFTIKFSGDVEDGKICNITPE